MSQNFLDSRFKWANNVKNLNFSVPEDNSKGYILRVSLEYLESVHDIHSDLPFFEHCAPLKFEETKIMATLYNQQWHVIHYPILVQALENGLVLKTIHWVLKFKQSDWPTSKFRNNVKSDFEKG